MKLTKIKSKTILINSNTNEHRIHTQMGGFMSYYIKKDTLKRLDTIVGEKIKQIVK